MNAEYILDPQLYLFPSRCFDSSRGCIHYIDDGDGPAQRCCAAPIPPGASGTHNIVVALRDRFNFIAHRTRLSRFRVL